jgi:hypothetical protein
VVVRDIYTERLRASTVKVRDNGCEHVCTLSRMAASYPHASELIVEGNMITTLPGKHFQVIATSLQYLAMSSATMAMKKFACAGPKKTLPNFKSSRTSNEIEVTGSMSEKVLRYH